MSLFTPAPLKDGLMMADSAVDLSGGSCVVLVVQNHSTTPVKMKKKCVLGQVVPVSSGTGDGSDGGSTVCNITDAMVTTEDRGTILLQKLQLELDHLPSEEQQHLKSLICFYVASSTGHFYFSL